MKNFFKGFLVALLLIPISDGLISIFNQFVQLVCTRIAVDTVELQHRIPDELLEESCEQTFAIGFQAPSSEEEYYDEEEDE